MSLIDELAGSPKLNAELLLQLAHLDPATDANEPLFRTAVKHVGATPLAVPGADIRPLNGRDTFVVDNLSLNGLKILVDNPGVIYVSRTSQLSLTTGVTGMSTSEYKDVFFKTEPLAVHMMLPPRQALLMAVRSALSLERDDLDPASEAKRVATAGEFQGYHLRMKAETADRLLKEGHAALTEIQPGPANAPAKIKSPRP